MPPTRTPQRSAKQTEEVEKPTLVTRVPDTFNADVYAVVFSYGDIAKLLGRPQNSRLVGAALKILPASLSSPELLQPPTSSSSPSSSSENDQPLPIPLPNPDFVPWHRVLSSSGIISPRAGGVRAVVRQADYLRAEGVEVTDGPRAGGGNAGPPAGLDAFGLGGVHGGHSYTASGYSPYNGIRNITGIGQTSSAGYNWLQYLAMTNPATSNNYFDFAVQGATTNNSDVEGSVPSLVDQVATFQQFFVPVNSTASVQVPWTPATTLFVVWIGINDIGYSYALSTGFPSLQSNLFIGTLEPLVLSTYASMVSVLCASGAVNLLFLGIPPMDRTPLVRAYGGTVPALFATNIASFNTKLSQFVQAVPVALPGVEAVLFDPQPFFNSVLNNFTSCGFQDGNSTCPGYEDVTDQPSLNVQTCPWSLAEYVWKNSYHLTWPVHKLLAGVIVEFLANGTGAIPTSVASVTVQQTTLPPTTVATSSPTSTCPACKCPAKSGGSRRSRGRGSWGMRVGVFAPAAAVGLLL